MNAFMTITKLYRCRVLLCLITVFGWSQNSLAYTGWCSPVDGTYSYSYDFGTKTITDPTKNAPGTTFLDAFQWDLGSTYMVTCDCESGVSSATYLKSITSLAMGHNDGKQYYKINDYLEVASSIYIGGFLMKYVDTPINNVSNQSPESKECGGASFNYASGSKGKLSLYIAKSFIGTSIFPNIKIVDLLASKTSGSYGNVPVSSVYVSGVVTVPQNCVIESGQVINVDFGSLYSGDFKVAGQKPDKAQIKTFNVPIKCTNIGAPANLTLRLQAMPDAHYADAITSDNPDVGVVVTNEQGGILVPNDVSSLIPFVTDTSGNANVTLKAYPVSTTGQTPAAGLFTALAYLRVDFA